MSQAVQLTSPLLRTCTTKPKRRVTLVSRMPLRDIRERLNTLAMDDRKKSTRIVMLGAPGVGKTALIIRCLTNQFFNHYVPGKEEAYQYTTHIGVKKVTLDIVDSNGKNNAIISYADAVVLVYSVLDRDSFSKITGLVNRVRDLNLNNVPIAIVANKIDQTKKRVVSKKEGSALAEAHDALFFERSAAIPTDSIGAVFADVYRAVMQRRKGRRDSDSNISDPLKKMILSDVSRRKSSSLDPKDFIKLVL